MVLAVGVTGAVGKSQARAANPRASSAGSIATARRILNLCIIFIPFQIMADELLGFAIMD
jgi:hypothetical protein